MDVIYDYLVIGAGSAGCAVAARLAADPQVRVALVEAGGPDRDPAIKVPAAFAALIGGEHDWDYRTEPQPELDGRTIRCPRGRVLGGSSSLNAQVWTRGHQADFDGWAAAGNPGWSYKEVEPYFRRAERRAGRNRAAVYGTDGPLHVQENRSPSAATGAFLEACRELGFSALAEMNTADNTGFARTPTTQYRGRRWSAADGYLRSSDHPNLTVLTRLQVQRIALRGTRAHGVEALDHRGRNVTLTARREVVLSAGAINSPHLLMLSGIGDPDHLRTHGITCAAALPGVGQGLQDHLFAPLIVRSLVRLPLTSARSLSSRLAYALLRRGPLASNIAEAACFLSSEAASSPPDLELGFLPAPFINHGLEPLTTDGMTIGVVLLQPASTGRVRLRSPWPNEPPKIDPAYLSDPGGEDIRLLIHGLRVARRAFDTTALAPYAGPPWYQDLDLDDAASAERHVRRRADTIYHPVGTCRMGNDGDAVVDARLRVHGVTGLRVVDASVMPRITRGHTHAPTVMIGERAADLMNEE
ncbi:choline dehydrogenase [Streptomyces sp. V2]|uniref:GMC family oxidoreductase n=1 Tax=Streptomyces TaxID=1883 RepID=UPI0006EB2C68|nr:MULTISPECIES: GMC family oxidoreductase N-terminal domain-containing protein [Streptomyces]PWG11837.1 choline dehydrogenase [Streptomyces sp. V2]